MFQIGLVSVSFRSLSPEEIIRLCVKNRLCGIEWGGDIHVPAGDTETARRVGEMTRSSGLRVFAYGSYYRVGTYGEDYEAEFSRVCDSAVALGAPVVRLWAYNKGSIDVTEKEFDRVAAELRFLSERAEERGLILTAECHNKTLTDDYHSSLKLLSAVDRPNFRMYWQPNQYKSADYNLEALRALLPYLVHLHVFHWIGKQKLPLSEGADLWKEYLNTVEPDSDRHALLFEFMPDGNPDTLARECDTLRKIL